MAADEGMRGERPIPLEALSSEHRALVEKGILLFNDGSFWEAHEAWEDVWREKDGTEKVLLQGLIQAAAAYHLLITRPRFRGAVRNLEKSLDKLRRCPARCYGVDIDALVSVAQRTHGYLQQTGDVPGDLRERRLIPRL